MVAVALVLAAVGALGEPHFLPGQSQEGVAQAQSTREAPEITALTQPTTSSIAVTWLPADNTDTHWLYAVKADGTDGRFQPAVSDPPPSQGATRQVTGVSHVTTVTGLAADTQYWFAILGVRAPADGSPSTWFRWSNWGRATTLMVATVFLGPDVAVAEGGTATLTVTASPAPQAPLTVNYAIGVHADPATTNGDSDDYTGTASGSIIIADGATTGSIAVVITDDSDIDDGAQETLVVTISLPQGSSYQLGERSSATVTITEGVCDRSAEVRTAILDALTGISACAAVTDADLRGMAGTLDLSNESLTAVQARDFRGLSGLQVLRLNHNALTALPADVFAGLTSLTTLSSSNNALAALPADVFDGLTDLTTLRLNNNGLTSLPDEVFDGLTDLEGLYLANNPGSAFTFTAAVEQTGAAQVTVAAAQAAPFDLSVTLSVQGGTLSDTSVTVPAGSRVGSAIALTPSGDGPVTVRATAAGFPGSGVEINGVTVTYNGIQTAVDAANQAPTADAGSDQTVGTGATVTLNALGSSDPDSGDTLSYHWEQPAGASVTLSSTTAASPTFTTPSSADDLTFQVTVMDGRGGSDRDTVAITVTANRPPTITSDPIFSLPENTTAVGPVIASDPDAADSVTGYTLGGTDAGLFAITAGGALTFSAAPDFEAPQGGASDDSNSYALTVTATGGAGTRALTTAQDLTVTVTDANEAPVFTSNAIFSVAENTTAAGTVIATDPDAADSITGYTLSGTDAGLFAITSGGDLSFTAAPDFEAPQGGASDDSNSYELTVTATGGAGGRALTVTVTDVSEAPEAPPVPTIGTATTTSLVVNWQAPANPGSAITDFDVQYRATDAASWSSWSHSGTARATTITGLDENTEYAVQVRAQNSYGESPWSPSASGTTVPDAPAITSVSSPSASSISFDWSLPSGPATITGYDILYRVSSTSTLSTWTHTGTSRSATITGLDENTEYAVQVRARNAGGPSEWWGSSGTTRPEAPSITSTSAASSSSIRLDWSLPGGPAAITGYDLQYREDGETDWEDRAHSGTGRSATISGLDDDTEYEVQVRAQNAGGMSEWSPSGTATTQEAPPPPPPPEPEPVTYPSAPRDLSASVSGTTITLSWNAPSDDGGAPITHYSFEWREVGHYWAAGGSTTGTSDTYNGAPGGNYEFRVAAHNSEGRGRWRHIFANT